MAKFFKTLFGLNKEKNDPQAGSVDTPTIPRQEPPGSDDITKPIRSVFGEADKPERRGDSQLQPLQLYASSGQSVGMQRDHNEDALFSLTTILSSQETQLPFGIYIVADGMGGHQYGEVASEIAVRTMADHAIEHLYSYLFSTKASRPATPLRDILHEGVQIAHQSIINEAPGGGTTLTTVIILDNQMAIAHVGDSRVYAIDDHGPMRALTRDHSLVKRLEELGQITADEAEIHPQRNILYRALGQGEPFEPEVITTSTPSSGHLLICSDGLWGVVSEKQIRQIIHETPHLDQACNQMIQAANQAGGPDNISLILIQLPRR